jgi:phosphopantothenate-cysteine ligase
LEYVAVSGTDSLETAIRRICAAGRVDAIIHAMAVSDYKPSGVTTIDDLAAAVFANSSTFKNPAELAQAIRGIVGFERTHKIGSNTGDLVIIAKPTQKVIALLRDLAPQAVIVGFKLLTDVPHAELIRAATGILTKNDCTYVLANDTAGIDATHHTGYLVDRWGAEQRFETKGDIAAGLVAATRKAWEETL